MHPTTDSPPAAIAAPRVKAWLERTTGAVLIAFGLRWPSSDAEAHASAGARTASEPQTTVTR
jgi:hypothetical protein